MKSLIRFWQFNLSTIKGKTVYKKIENLYALFGRRAFTFFRVPSNSQVQVLLFMMGFSLLLLAITSEGVCQEELGNFDDTRFAKAMTILFTYIEGSFGALVMACAGLGSILASAFGQYRASLSCLVVALGSFILKSVVATFFNIDNVDFSE